MADAMLAVRNVATFYGAIQALHGVDLDVAQGEIVTLIGANGAGKSTLLMTVCGNPRARVGTIKLDGEDITHLPTHEIDRVLTMFPRLAERREQRGGTLSGGEQQMLAIGRALMSRPRLLLLDEPSLGLAPLVVKLIFDAIRDLNRTQKLTIFLVEQNAFHALKLAHRGYVMVNGRITLSGSGRELLQRPEVKAAYLEGGRH